MTLRDEIADEFDSCCDEEGRVAVGFTLIADRVLALMWNRGMELYHGMTISWPHDGPLLLLDLGERPSRFVKQ